MSYYSDPLVTLLHGDEERKIVDDIITLLIDGQGDVALEFLKALRDEGPGRIAVLYDRWADVIVDARAHRGAA